MNLQPHSMATTPTSNATVAIETNGTDERSDDTEADLLHIGTSE
jgi:hypothetical protein